MSLGNAFALNSGDTPATKIYFRKLQNRNDELINLRLFFRGEQSFMSLADALNLMGFAGMS
jgi:hypothetical protein